MLGIGESEGRVPGGGWRNCIWLIWYLYISCTKNGPGSEVMMSHKDTEILGNVSWTVCLSLMIYRYVFGLVKKTSAFVKISNN